MRETLLHVQEALDEADRNALYRALGEKGASSSERFKSQKPHLLFIRYDETATEPSALIEAAKMQGVNACLVDV